MEQNQDIYDVIVIGSGLGGLSTASLLAQKGKRVLVIEKHYIVGGYATNFQRKGFTFDVSLHSINGMRPESDSFNVIRDCGVADKITFLPHQKLYRLRRGQFDFDVNHCDLNGYIDLLEKLFPDESVNIRRLFKEAKAHFQTINRFLYSKWPFWLRIVLMPFFFLKVLRYDHDSTNKFFSRFLNNQELKDVMSAQWTYYGLPPERAAYTYMAYPFVDYLENGGYSIQGGSQTLSNALADVIVAHGGKVLTKCAVNRVIMNRRRAIGVETKRRGSFYAKDIISNISPFALTQLVGRSYFPTKFLKKMNRLELSTSAFQVYLGLDVSLDAIGVSPDEYIEFHQSSSPIAKQYASMQDGDIAGDVSFSLNFFSNIDSSLAPDGKSTLGIFSLIGANWPDCPRDEYKRRKAKLAETLIDKAEQIYPGLRNHIEVCEVGTPRTMERFTENTNGSIYGFAMSVEQSGFLRRFPQKYPIKNLYQVGAWTFPGSGFMGALLSSRVLVDRFWPRKSY